MKIMICGGGTAGHVYPGLALAEALNSVDKDINIVFVGSTGALEAKVVREAGYQLETLPIKGMPRKISLQAVLFALRLAISFTKAFMLLRKHRPSVCIGMGGFAAYPAVVLAGILKIPTVIHEQNSIMGLANRKLLGRADLVALTYDGKDSLVRRARRVVVVGNPVRQSVMAADPGPSRQALGLEDGRVTVLIFGGSRGARKINEAALAAYPLIRSAENLQIAHVTGIMEHEKVTGQLAKAKGPHDKINYQLFPYIEDMGPAYAAADIIIARAGATTLAEITARGLPSVLVPYPYATDDHQVANAKKLEAVGAARIILDDNLDGRSLSKAVRSLIDEPSKLGEMGDRSAALGRPKAAAELAALVLDLANSAMITNERETDRVET